MLKYHHAGYCVEAYCGHRISAQRVENERIHCTSLFPEIFEESFSHRFGHAPADGDALSAVKNELISFHGGYSVKVDKKAFVALDEPFADDLFYI